MVRRILAGIGVSVVVSALAYAQGQAPPPAGGRGGAPKLPTEAQWAAMSPKAKEYVDKARAIAGKDPDLVFDFGIFCKASGGSQNEDRASVGVPESEPKLRPYPAPTPPKVIGGQRLFDNFYWIGNTGIGAWLITSNDGYILFDTMNSEEDARDIIIPAIKKLGLDPMKIKYLVFGHNHFDHTGGGEYIQRMTGAKAVMHRDDWEIYLKSTGRGGGGRGGRGGADAPAAAPAPPPAATPKMKRDIDATDGMKITVGDVTGTIFTMTGHTPGSIGMVVPVKWQGTTHPILLVTAGTDVNNRGDFVGGYEHIWDEAIKMKVENVMQAHPNTNMNLLARTTYVHDSYPPAKNPLLYGADRTERYINIMRNCTLARMEILGAGDAAVRALIKTAPGVGHLEILETKTPVPGPGEALVRVGPSGLCGTDLLLFDGVYRGRNRPVPSPLIVGHEASGEVIGLGPGTAGPAPGTRVGIEAVTGCGVCFHCLRGNYNLCQDWHHIGLTRPGVLAEFVVVPAASLLPLPEEVTLESAAFLEPLATAVHTVERVRPAPGTTAAIIGPGPLGFLHLQVLQAAGLGPIVMYGQAGDEARLELAASLGAGVFLGDRSAIAQHARHATNGIGFGLSIESGGTSAAIQTALDIVAGNGTLVSLGIVRTTELDVLQVMRKNVTWIGVVASVRRHFADAIELIRMGKVRPHELITHRLSLGDALTGFDVLRQREAVKVMVSLMA